MLNDTISGNQVTGSSRLKPPSVRLSDTGSIYCRYYRYLTGGGSGGPGWGIWSPGWGICRRWSPDALGYLCNSIMTQQYKVDTNLDSASTASLGGNPSAPGPTSTARHRQQHSEHTHPGRPAPTGRSGTQAPVGKHASMQHLESRNGHVITNRTFNPRRRSVCRGQPCMALVYGCEPAGPTGLTPPPGHRSRPQPGKRSPVQFRIQPPHPTSLCPPRSPPHHPCLFLYGLYRSYFDFNKYPRGTCTPTGTTHLWAGRVYGHKPYI